MGLIDGFSASERDRLAVLLRRVADRRLPALSSWDADLLRRLAGLLDRGPVIHQGFVSGSALCRLMEGPVRAVVPVGDSRATCLVCEEARTRLCAGSTAPPASESTEGVTEAPPEVLRGATGDAVVWLKSYLTGLGGSADMKNIRKAARDAGFSDATIDRAKSKLGVRSEQMGFGAAKRSIWFLEA